MSIVDEIYDGLTDEEALAALPARLAAAAGARSCTLHAFTPDNRLLLMLQNGYYPQDMYDFYVATSMHEHDFWRPAYQRRENLHRALSAEKVLDPSGYEGSIFYNEFFRRFGDDTARFLGGVAPHGKGVFTLALHRGRIHDPFGDEEESVVQPLIAHLRRVFEMRAAIADADTRAAKADRLLDALAQAVLVVDGAGALMFANRWGEDLLRPGGPLTTRGGVIRARDPKTDKRLGDLVLSAAEGVNGHGGATRVAIGDGRHLRAVVAPWRAEGFTQVLIVLDDPGEANPTIVMKLRGLYGLTPG